MRLAFPGLAPLFEEKPTVITSSSLLAAAAARQFADLRIERGEKSWPRPAIFHVEAWLISCWQEARYTLSGIPALLSPPQERLLWQKVIQQDQPPLFDIAATARLARDAARLAAEWRIPFQGEAWADHQDGRYFQRWHASFRSECSKRDCITRSDLWDLLPGWMDRGLPKQPPALFIGFDKSSPTLKQLVGKLPDSTLVAPALQSEHTGPAAAIQPRIDLRDEIEHAARWARAAFEAHPSQSIAVFIPDLRNHRSLVERTFRNVLYPASGLRLVTERRISVTDEDSVFHIDSPSTLQDHPLIASALLFLALGSPRIDHADATAILRSPFVKGAVAERNARAIADLNLRRLRELDVSVRDLERASRDCPQFASVWMAVRNVLAEKESRADLSIWSKFIGDLLHALGWPGDVELSARDQDAVEGWNDVLSTLGALGMVSGPVSFDAALRHLKAVLGTEGLQTGDWSSPLQILNAADASGLHFDSAYLVGLSDDLWPPLQRTQPLIPLQLQRAAGVPNTTPDALHVERERLTRALFACAPVVQGSCHGRLSPLAAPFIKLSVPEHRSWTGNVPLQSFVPAELDEVEDNQAPPFDVTKNVRGGTTIIKLQSLCPFRAFAEIRLRAQTPDDACFGFDSRDRGGFLHKAMQFVWQDLRTRDALCALPDAKLQTLVRDAILRAVKDDQDSEFHLQAAEVERERLEYLIIDWLNTVEKRRPAAFTVETVEDELHYNLAGLPLRLRIDRVDRLKNGRILLFDYKSGKQSRGKLECPRPAEPQLLVYAAAKGSEVDGIFFGEVKPRDLRVVGISREKQVTSKSVTVKKGDWDEFMEGARDEVHRLAGDFLSGNALVDPRNNACDFCDNKPFCRVNEKSETAAQGEA